MLKVLDLLIAYKAISLSDLISGTDKRVGATTLDHFNRTTGQCDPSINTIAELLSVSRRTVVRSFGRLVKVGLFRKVKHGGKFHRNSYEPMWSVFRQLEKAWTDRRRARRMAFRPPNVSLYEGQTRHSTDDEDVTQTYSKNQFEKTLRGSPAKALPSVLRATEESGLADFEGWTAAPGAIQRLRNTIGEAVCREWFRNVGFVACRDGVTFSFRPQFLFLR